MKENTSNKIKKTSLQKWIDNAIQTKRSDLDTISDFKINDNEKISKSVAIAFNLLHRYLSYMNGIRYDRERNPFKIDFDKFLSGNKNLFKSPQNAEVSYDFSDIFTELYNLYDAYVTKGKHSEIENAERQFINENRPFFFKFINNDSDNQKLQNIFSIFKNRQFTTSILANDEKVGSGSGKTDFKAGTYFNNGNENNSDTDSDSGFGNLGLGAKANSSDKENNQQSSETTNNKDSIKGPTGQAEKKMAAILAPFNKKIFNIDSQRIYKEISANRKYDFAEEFKQFDEAITHLKNLKDVVDDTKEKLTSLRKEHLDKAKKKYIQPAINSVTNLKASSSKILTDLHKVDFITERAAFKAAGKIINNMISAQSIVGNLGINLSWAARPTWLERRISDVDHAHRAWENIKNNTVRSSRLIHDAVAWNDARTANDYAKRMRKEWPGEEGEKRADEFVKLYTSKDPKDIQRCQQLVAELEEKTDSKTLPVKAWKKAKSVLSKAKESFLGKDDENTEVHYDLDEKGNRVNFKRTRTNDKEEGILNKIKNKFVKSKAEQEKEEEAKENKKIDQELEKKRREIEAEKEKETKQIKKEREKIFKDADKAFLKKKSIFDKIKGKIK